MMDLGQDFFKWFRFAIELMKLLTRIFGNDDDQKELKKNGFGPESH